uniref:AXH domain-containing protein n=1 Tax=Plectus sambesii TaxID=2011161 RepID=A0A914W3N7_9BILA
MVAAKNKSKPCDSEHRCDSRRALVTDAPSLGVFSFFARKLRCFEHCQPLHSPGASSSSTVLVVRCSSMNGAPLRNFAPPTPQQQQQLQQQQQQIQLHQHQQLQQQLHAAVAAAAAASTSGGAGSVADPPRTPTTPVVSRPPTHWPNLSPDLQALRPPFYPRLDPALANRLYFGQLQSGGGGGGGGGGGPTSGVSALQFQPQTAGAAGTAAAANAALLQQSAAYQHYVLAGSNAAAAAAAAQHYAAASRLPHYLDPTTFLASSAMPRYPYLLNAPSSPSTRHPHSPQQSTGMPPPPPPAPLQHGAAASVLERSYSDSDGVLGSGGLMGLRDIHQRKLSAHSMSSSANRHSHVGLPLVTASSAPSTPPRPKLDPRTGPTELGATLPTQPYYPSHFMRGTVIQLASGELKRVEELNTEDFIRSASLSDDLKMDSSTVVRVEEKTKDTSVLLCFSVGEHKVQVSVEATVEHPFFVIGQGWSSCNPDRTRNLYGLPCQRLQVGDICISLTHRDVHTKLPSQATVTSGQALPLQPAITAGASSSSSPTTGSTLSLPTTAAAAVASMSASSAVDPPSSSGRRSAPASSAFHPIGSKRRWSVSP